MVPQNNKIGNAPSVTFHQTNDLFAFIVHPLSIRHLRGVIHSHPGLKTKINVTKISEETVFELPPIEILSLKFRFGAKQVSCLGILCPLLPAQMVANQEQAVSHILNATQLARDRGAKLVGLGGFTSIIGDNGLKIAKKSSLPVTSGNTYTAVVILKSIALAAKLLNLEIKNANIAIIGATGDIGSACARKLALSGASLLLVARNEEKLQSLASELSRNCPVEVIRKPSEAASKADIIITVTSAITTLINACDLRRGSIVCDASYPANIASEIHNLRHDVLVFEGGIVSWEELNRQVDKNSALWHFNPPTGVHGCFAEALLLALEGKFVTYSIGRGNITFDKLEEMDQFASKYNFHPVQFWQSEELKKLNLLGRHL